MIFCLHTLIENFKPSAEFKRFWNRHPVSSIFFSVDHRHPKSVRCSVYCDLTARYRKKWSQMHFVQQLLFVFHKIIFLGKWYLVPSQVLVDRVMGIEIVLTLATKNLLYRTQPVLKLKAFSDQIVLSWHGWFQLSYFEGTCNG